MPLYYMSQGKSFYFLFHYIHLTAIITTFQLNFSKQNMIYVLNMIYCRSVPNVYKVKICSKYNVKMLTHQ